VRSNLSLEVELALAEAAVVLLAPGAGRPRYRTCAILLPIASSRSRRAARMSAFNSSMASVRIHGGVAGHLEVADHLHFASCDNQGG
jgi:hypothetical protein